MSHAATVRAPEFPEGMEWLNTDKPIKLKDLRGKIVLLDFWTYCCINCLHVLPDLKKLEQKYKNELVVIGVHSGKFDTEKDAENIRQAILRHEIEHPVVNDKDYEIWESYTVRAWPTFYLIDPDGYVVGYTSGEGIYEPFDKLIGKLVKDFKAKKKLKENPTAFQLERDKIAKKTTLSFPGKIISDEKSKRLFISDSNHNRIVITDTTGKILETIGQGEAGLKDGGFDVAQFDHPQGLALDGNKLYIADTENHALRMADLEAKTVTTLAGNGKQAAFGARGGKASPNFSLNSPWDLLVHKDHLYIAMAGPHQLWRLNLKTNELAVHSGSGRENIFDGPHGMSALAQPSGITTDGTKLYFADSEVSALRSSDIDPNGGVQTLIGKGLFAFGDQDGLSIDAKLQHPLGVVYHNKKIYLTDTYNDKVKVFDLEMLRIKTLSDGFDEPAGLTYLDGKLYIANTNAHTIEVLDLVSNTRTTLNVQ